MRLRTYLGLHLLLVMYSLSGIFSKLASSAPFLSLSFFLCYGAVLLILFVYALGWQQVIKRMPLSAAFANKAVTVVWGIVWGLTIFHEPVNLFKIVGAGIIIAGIVLFSLSDSGASQEGRDASHV
ncbi:transporter [Collinsella sp. AGMB00827]|uniref:Transporter n=1 Tax=Collinsella ureilytica TaxID=2869515 RepID=A0ABS7MI04_9ACTN|nr:transporter [Collinsella urealyticum]MBY4796994.1 transporter [Collinsella urealyticum]